MCYSDFKMKKNLMFSGILMILPVISCGVSYDQMINLGYSLVEDADGWLKFHQTPLSWDEAVLTCFNEAILASPLNDGIIDAISSQMVLEGITFTPIFTGVSNVYSDAVYQSMEGIPSSDLCLTWSSPPKGSDAKNCIGMFMNGTVTEVSCVTPRPFACYKNKEEVSKGCGTSDTEYIFNNRTGSCYKLHQNKANWHDAFKVCDAEGGHLAIVNSQAEAEVIWEIGYNSPWTYALALGFREWGKERTWITIKGQSLSDAGYDKWYPGEPNILTENCGCFVHWGSPKNDGILADMPCKVDVMFICEIDP